LPSGHVAVVFATAPSYEGGTLDIRAQISMVFHLDKCIGCHTCSIACKNLWTDRRGAEYMWWNNVETKPGTGYPHRWEDQEDYKEIYQVMNTVLPLKPEDVKEIADPIEMINYLVTIAEREYKAKKERLGQLMPQLERLVYLRTIDLLWQEHLDTMEHLRDSVRLRGYGQRDPLLEFKREGFELFQRLLAEIDKQIVYTIFKVDVVQQPVSRVQGTGVSKNIGRNDPCPCGSGKKWKKCGLLQTEEHKKLMAQKQ